MMISCTREIVWALLSAVEVGYTPTALMVQEDKVEAAAELQASVHRLVLSTTRAARCVGSLQSQAALANACAMTFGNYSLVVCTLQRALGNVTNPATLALIQTCQEAGQSLLHLLSVKREIHA